MGITVAWLYCSHSSQSGGCVSMYSLIMRLDSTEPWPLVVILLWVWKSIRWLVREWGPELEHWWALFIRSPPLIYLPPDQRSLLTKLHPLSLSTPSLSTPPHYTLIICLVSFIVSPSAGDGGYNDLKACERAAQGTRAIQCQLYFCLHVEIVIVKDPLKLAAFVCPASLCIDAVRHLINIIPFTSEHVFCPLACQ